MEYSLVTNKKVCMHLWLRLSRANTESISVV